MPTRGRRIRTFGVNGDGTRFALLAEISERGKRTNVTVVLNFTRDIERVLAAGR